MPEPVQTALIFLIQTTFNLLIMLLIIRLILVWVGANYYSPFTHFVAKSTDWLVKPFRKIIPNYKKIETVTIGLILLTEIIKFLLLASLNLAFPDVLGLFILAIGDSFKQLIYVFFYGIILQAIISWVQPHSPMSYGLYQLVSPVLRPFQRLIPPISGFDISPIPAIISLQLLLILLVQPLLSFGAGVAFG